MLDLEALIADMRGLAGEVADSARRTVRQRAEALDRLQVAAEMEGLRDAVLRFQQDMACPADAGRMSAVYPPPTAEDYAVIATDGSQIPPDYHHVAAWSVINAGCVILRYGTAAARGRSHLASHPRLLPPRRGEIPAADSGPAARRAALDPDDDASADAQAASGAAPGSIEVERLLAELDLARRLVEQESAGDDAVLLLDGPLVQWRMITSLRTQPEDQRRVIGAFQSLLGAAYEARVPVAGFISRSRAVEWVTLLRFSMCPDVPRLGKLCPLCNQTLLKRSRYEQPPAGAHHAALAGLRDVQVAGELLRAAPPGSRTEFLELRSSVWEEVTGGGDPAGFFYMKTEEPRSGGETARVELPGWVARRPELLARLHAAVWDQCRAGRGYPMVLAEAHEQAVVRGPERSAFYALLERVLESEGVDEPATSAKAASKRRPMA